MDISMIKNMKDFQLLYNEICELCFKTCIGTFLSRDISTNEGQCIENCSSKYIYANRVIMKTFMEVQPIITRRNIEEFEKAQAELEKQAPNEMGENTT